MFVCMIVSLCTTWLKVKKKFPSVYIIIQTLKHSLRDQATLRSGLFHALKVNNTKPHPLKLVTNTSC